MRVLVGGSGRSFVFVIVLFVNFVFEGRLRKVRVRSKLC